MIVKRRKYFVSSPKMLKVFLQKKKGVEICDLRRKNVNSIAVFEFHMLFDFINAFLSCETLVKHLSALTKMIG